MSLLTLEQAKSHCRVDGDDEDALISLYMSAAEQSAADFVNRKIYASQTEVDEAGDDAGDCPLVATEAVRAACLLILGSLYANREAVSATPAVEMPLGARDLLRPYRVVMMP